MAGYIRWLRDRVGPGLIQLNFAAACVVDAGRVVLQRRADHNAWGFPGGAIELGESVEDAVVREVREETGLEVRVDGLLGVYTKYEQSYPNGDVAQPMTVFCRCAPVGGYLGTANDETIEARYFPLGDVPELFSAQHQDALADLIADRSAVLR
jgi:mutator protein MutT